MKILLFGRDGQLGRELAPSLAALADVESVGHADVDLADSERLRSRVLETRPDVVINAAAYTAVDRAEDEPEVARAVNALAPAVLAQATASIDALFVHYSTDYVFDGRAARPYSEDDATAPVGVYGRTKREGEEAVQAAGGAHLILRTAWLYSATGKNFLTTMLRLARERDSLRVVADQIGSPTSTAVVAQATLTALRALGTDRSRARGASGIYHVTCGGAVSWHGFASRIVALAGLDRVRVDAITTAEYPTRARRPAYSVLDNRKFSATFGLVFPAWEDALRQCMIAHGLAKQR